MLRVVSLVLAGSFLVSCACIEAQAIGEGKYFLSRLSLRHREHKGMGYDQGYSTAALFMCPKIGIIGLPFVDGRVHVFNNEDVAANLGVGARFSDAQQRYLIGFNTYYDYRNMHWLVTHQLSSGLEILSEHVDFRLNGYYPFSGKYQDDPIRFSRFKGNHLQVKHKVRYALPCADAELGWTLPDPFDQIGLYLGVGYYYLFKQHGFNRDMGNVPGVRGRLTASPSSYLSFGAEYTYDKLFRGRANGFIALNIPLGVNRSSVMSKKSGGKTPWLKMQTQDVVRNEIVPVVRKTHRFNQLRSDGEPMHFVFVNNQGSHSGEGTFERPYTTLAQGQEHAAENDVVYVFAGDGSSKGYDEGITLKSGQVLASSGASVHINGVEIPALTPDRLPLLTNHGSVIHVTTPGTTISGFKIEGQEGEAIYVEGVEVTLLNNEITAAKGFSAFKAVGAEQIRGKSLLQNNLFIGQGGMQSPVVDLDSVAGVYIISDNQIIAADGQHGIRIANPNSKTSVLYNEFVSNDPSGIALEYQITDELSSKEHVCRYNNVTEGFYKALHIENAVQSDTLFEVHDNKFISETLGVGISYSSASHHGFLSIMNNSIVSSQEGIEISDHAEAANAIEITGNRISCYSGTPAISSIFSGAMDVTIEENQIDYASNIKGQFSGIVSRIKENEDLGSRLVIKHNVLNMPGDQQGVQVINERSAEMVLEVVDNGELEPLNIHEQEKLQD